ncbi:hypothetical protein DVA76_18865, partial [Acinetobacter baumannii]
AVSKTKYILCQTKIKFLGHEIYNNTLKPIQRSLEFADKFSDKITDKNQLQRCLGALNYVCESYKHIKVLAKPLYKGLRKNPVPWTE